MEVKCVYCGKVFETARTRKYCSESCKQKEAIERMKANAKPKKCAECGKEFMQWGKKKYCSVECQKAAQIKFIKKYKQAHKEPMDNPKCKTCVWRGHIGEYVPCCDFYLRTGELRGCEGGMKCTRYERRSR